MNEQPEANGTQLKAEAAFLHAVLTDRAARFILGGILLFLTIGFLYVARDFLLPVAIAILFSLVLNPVVRWLYRRGVPPPVTAIAVVAGLLVGLLSAAYLVSGPVAALISDAPRIGYEIQQKVAVLGRPMDAINRAAAQIQDIVSADEEEAGRVVVEEEDETWEFGYIASDASQRLAAIGLSLVLLLFILASGDLFQEKLIKVLPTLSDKKMALRIVREVEYEVSRYILTMTFINIGVAIVVGFAFWFLGMPSPALWSFVALLANYLPYIGPALVAIATLGIGILAFDTLAQGVIPFLVFIFISVVEGQIVTPLIVGQRHALNSVVILVSIAFWGWIWGIVGALLAVPMLVTIKVFAEYVDLFRPLGEFLSARHNGPMDHVEEDASPSSARPGAA